MTKREAGERDRHHDVHATTVPRGSAIEIVARQYAKGEHSATKRNMREAVCCECCKLRTLRFGFRRLVQSMVAIAGVA